MFTTTISHEIVNDLIDRGASLLYNHFVQKQKMPIYVSQIADSWNDDCVIQSGLLSEKIIENKTVEQNVASRIIKDIYCSKSLRIDKIQTKLLPKEYAPTQKKRKFFKPYLQKQIKTNRINPQKEAKAEIVKCQLKEALLKLNWEPDNQISHRVPAANFLMFEAKRQSQMRETKIKQKASSIESQRTQIHRQTSRVQRANKLRSSLENHLKGKQSRFTYGEDGNMLMFKAYDHQCLFKKAFPVRTSFLVRNDSAMMNSKRNSPQQHLKTRLFNQQSKRISSVNEERMATEMFKTTHQGQTLSEWTTKQSNADQFVARNSFFNNNNARQTTNIPYFEAREGVVYTEESTDHKINGSERRRKSTTERTHNYLSSERSVGQYRRFEQDSVSKQRTLRITPQHLQNIRYGDINEVPGKAIKTIF